MAIFRYKVPDIIYLDYDPDADSVYIKMRDAKIKKTKEAGTKENPMILDLDAKGRLVGIEIIGVSTLKKSQQSKVLSSLSARYHTSILKHINTQAIGSLYI